MTTHAAADPKLLDLTEALAQFLKQQGYDLPLSLVESTAIGLLARLKEFTNQHAPAGDIGRHADRAIARAIGWTGFGDKDEDAAWIIEQLVALQILAREETHRLIVCDWPQQCEPTCHQFVADHGIPFADGTAGTRRPKQNSPVGRVRRAEQIAKEGDLERTSTGQPQKKEPPAETGSKGKAVVDAAGTVPGARPDASSASHGPDRHADNLDRSEFEEKLYRSLLNGFSN